TDPKGSFPDTPLTPWLHSFPNALVYVYSLQSKIMTAAEKLRLPSRNQWILKIIFRIPVKYLGLLITITCINRFLPSRLPLSQYRPLLPGRFQKKRAFFEKRLSFLLICIGKDNGSPAFMAAEHHSFCGKLIAYSQRIVGGK